MDLIGVVALRRAKTLLPRYPMTRIDWLLVIGVNGAIIVYGLVRARGTKSSADWFLAARGLPWWIVGLSMFATAVDSGDYVAIAGGAYTFGISMITQWWLGLTIAWLLAAYFLFLPLYRSGMYTNAEYLEYRFGPATRTLSVLIQIQHRTNVLGNVAFSLYLTFSLLTGWGKGTWILVVLIALGAAWYTASGGLRSVAWTDALQSVAMLIAAVLLWVMVWSAVGGWSGLEEKLGAGGPKLVESMLHVGGRGESGAPAALFVLGWIITLFAYCVVNHSQSMRMLAARSEWDMKMAAVVASVVTVVMMWFNITIGILGRAVFPTLGLPDKPPVDQCYPLLVQGFLGPGAVGLVVAGLLAGGISTYDSIGSALSALFTRDLYARFFVTDRDDAHYVWVSRIVTYVMIGISFAYVPFLNVGMVSFYLGLTVVAVVPLFCVHLMGALTRVHKAAGIVGLIVGIGYGLSSFLADQLGWDVPIWYKHVMWRYLWSVVVTSGSMVATSVVAGWADREELQGLAYSKRPVEPHPEPPVSPGSPAPTWLEATHRAVPPRPAYPFPLPAGGLPWYRRPHLWAFLLIGLVAYLNLVVLW